MSACLRGRRIASPGSTGEGQLLQSVVRRGFVAVAGAAVLLLGVTAVPAQAAGAPVGIRKLSTVNLREAAAGARHGQYRPALRNLPAAKQFAALEERRNGGEGAPRQPAPVLQQRRVAEQPITSHEVDIGFEGQHISNTVSSQGEENQPPDQGLCGGTV